MSAPQTRHDDFLGVRSLAAITIAICLLSGVACLLTSRVRIEFAVWCGAVAFCGTLGCLFLAGMVAVAFFREGRRHRLALGLGVGFGLAPFTIYCFYVGIH
jgi:hypothetical protein